MNRIELDSRRHTKCHGQRRHDGVRGNHCARANERAGSDVSAVQHNAAHTDEGICVNRAALKVREVADGDPLTDNGWQVVCGVNDYPVLHRRP